MGKVKDSNIIKTRKIHTCDCCSQVIEKGSQALYERFRVGKYDDEDVQIGIEYFQYWIHVDCIEPPDPPKEDR